MDCWHAYPPSIKVEPSARTPAALCRAAADHLSLEIPVKPPYSPLLPPSSTSVGRNWLPMTKLSHSSSDVSRANLVPWHLGRRVGGEGKPRGPFSVSWGFSRVREVRCAAQGDGAWGGGSGGGPEGGSGGGPEGADEEERRGEGGPGTGDRDGRGEEPEIEKALHMDARIPSTADQFLQKVSSKAYEMRRRMEQTLEANSYDVVEANPWSQEAEKPLYVLAQQEDKLYTMRTRRARSEVERELDLLFPQSQRRGHPNFLSRDRTRTPSPSWAPVSSGAGGGGGGGSSGASAPGGREGSRFHMYVEDVREGVLVFEDEDDAARYCRVLEGHGQRCAGIAQVPAKEVFALCQQSQALAVLFRRGVTPPAPHRLQLNLRARKHSLED